MIQHLRALRNTVPAVCRTAEGCFARQRARYAHARCALRAHVARTGFDLFSGRSFCWRRHAHAPSHGAGCCAASLLPFALRRLPCVTHETEGAQALLP